MMLVENIADMMKVGREREKMKYILKKKRKKRGYNYIFGL